MRGGLLVSLLTHIIYIYIYVYIYIYIYFFFFEKDLEWEMGTKV